MKHSGMIKTTLIGAVLAFAPLHAPAFAENAEVSVLNTRGEDGIYRPALRIIRGGVVTYIAAGEQGLTEAILQDESQLSDWLAANVPAADPADPITFQIVEVQPPSAPGVRDCLAAANAGEKCTKEEAFAYCTASVPGFTGWAAPTFATPEDYCYD